MTYSKGHRMIAVERSGVFNPGKRPALYIGEGNKLLRVGVFGSEEKAELFEEFLEYFFGDRLVKMEDGK